MGLAQVAEVFAHTRGAADALEVIERRSGRWFDPELVVAFRTLAHDAAFWASLAQGDVDHLVKAVEPEQVRIVADESRLDQIADAFASLIDAKSPYTSDHSRRVASLAVAIGERLGFTAPELTRVRRAALLHDIGKLGTPSRILEKNGPLTAEEWQVVKAHPAHTLQILQAVPGFRDFAFDAACHHEKLDGSGYHCGYTADHLSPTARALTVADMADALLTDRPYRPALEPLEALRILHGDCVAGQLCPDSVDAFTDYVAERLMSGAAADLEHPVTASRPAQAARAR
jgi:putative nucleotidyltransferase with HDIG domain